MSGTRVVKSVAEWRKVLASPAHARKSVGFVPTMGALHPGHFALLDRARRENDVVVLSIFVNPTQFDDAVDFERYPNTLDADLEVARNAGVDYVFAPTRDEIYPNGYVYRVTENEFSRLMEGAHRPGHFDGVLTVVLKLLILVRADRAYFGEKDRQQLMLVRGMVAEFFLPVEIVSAPTVRSDSGLALSSRNQHLSAESRLKAAEFSRILRSSADVAALRHALEKAGFAVDYVEKHGNWIFGAVRLEGVRLIDNVCIEHPV